MANMCLPEEGCEWWKLINFGVVMSRPMYLNTMHVVYNGYKAGFGVVGMRTSENR